MLGCAAPGSYGSFIHSFNHLMCACARPCAHECEHFFMRLDLCHTQCNMHQFVVETDANMYNSGNGVLRYRWVHDGVRLIFRTTCSLLSRLETATKKSLEKHRNDTHHYYKAIFSPFMHIHTPRAQAYSHRTAQSMLLTGFSFLFRLRSFFLRLLTPHSHTFQICDYIKIYRE